MPNQRMQRTKATDARIVGRMKDMTDVPSVREMTHEDPQIMAEVFRAQGWNKPQDQYEKYYGEQTGSRRTVLVAELKGKFVGYLTIVWESDYSPFRDAGIPEIVDLNVVLAQQRKGIGSVLMDKAELRISEKSKVVGIGVGLSSDYGAAQILYVKRGYLPDGRGLHFHGRQLRFGDKTTVDHSLVMYFTKKLKGS